MDNHQQGRRGVFQGVGGAVPWGSQSGQKGIIYTSGVCVQQVEMYELLQVFDPTDRGGERRRRPVERRLRGGI